MHKVEKIKLRLREVIYVALDHSSRNSDSNYTYKHTHTVRPEGIWPCNMKSGDIY